MKKATYERASLAVVAFDAKDIITTSGQPGGGTIVLPDDDFNIFG